MSEENLRFFVDHVIWSMEMEKQREKSIADQSNRLLTAQAMMLTAVTLKKDNILPQNSCNKGTYVVIFFVLIGLLMSLIFNLISQWRYEYKTLPSLENVKKELEKDSEQIGEDFQLKYKGEHFPRVYSSLKKLNDVRCFFIKISLAILGVDVILTGVLIVLLFL